ncbi:uncharacterized protein LOC143917818 [Arctopsyche grandis]|uniref:uncharacterized protein LOC143917818 n=1 Tax=Arctopsyche grandis TaxID=121162 RepID=UPI00406D9EED
MMASFVSPGPLIRSGNICCCCLGNSNLQSLVQPHCDNDDTEVYSDTIHRCYGIQMIGNDDPIKHLYHICDTCIMRLKDASTFRLQIEMSYESLQKYLIHENFVEEVTCKFETTFNDAENNFDADDSFSYPTNLKTEELFEPSLSNDLKIEMKQNEIKTKPNNVISNSIDKKLNKSVSKIGGKTSRKDKNGISKKVKKIVTQTKPNIQKIKAKRVRKVEVKPFKLDENDVTCKICNETFPWHFTLKCHMSVHFPNHICDVCGKFSVTKKNFQAHVRSHLHKSEKTCEICNKTCEARNFHLHMRNHRDIKINKCPQCSERFKTFRQKVKHLIDVHNDEPNKYKCTLCPKRYLLPGPLKSHVRNAHLNERKHECTECLHKFFYLNDLKKHMLKHTGEKNFECDVCKKRYGKRWTLTEHMKIHNNEKNYVCPTCSRAFTQKCTLKVHMKTHEKEKLESDFT